MLPHALARTRPNGAPQIAGLVQASFAAIVAVLFFIAGLDPILNLVPAMLGFGTLAVLVLQGLAALAIIVHFRRTRDPRWWSTLIAPGIGFLGTRHDHRARPSSTSTSSRFQPNLSIRLMPLLLVVALIGGIIYGAYLKRSKPAVYDALATDIEKFNVHVTHGNEVPHIPEPSI